MVDKDPPLKDNPGPPAVSPHPPDKQLLQTSWDGMKQHVDSLIDGKGRGMDERIKEPVIALNLLKVNTIQSCEGHMPVPGHYSVYPYIAIGAKEADELGKAAEASHKKATTNANPALTETLWNEYHQILAKSKQLNLIETKKVMILLDEFYANRKTSAEVRLIVDIEDMGNNRIRPQGGELFYLEESDERK